MDQFLPVIGAIALLLIAFDGIAFMIGRRNFPVMRFAVKCVRRLIGGAFISAGKAIRGGGKRR